MACELIRLYTLEAVHRSAKSAKSESNVKAVANNTKMDVCHLQRVAAGLTLDFGG